MKISKKLIEKIANIKLMIFDVDGVLTDGKLYYGASGEELKVFHVHDGHGIKMLQNIGIKVAIISGRKSAALLKRLSELKINYVYTGVGENKIDSFNQLLKKTKISAKNCGVIGDDIPDLALFAQCNFSACPPLAIEKIKKAADYQTKNFGGNGAVRELCDLIIKVQKPDDE